MPTPRFASLTDFETYVRTSANSIPKQTVAAILLCAAERAVERYTRRRFAPQPALDPEYTRQVVGISGQVGTLLPAQVSGALSLSFEGHSTGSLALPLTAAALQAALEGLSPIGAGNVLCTGGPLAAYPISVIWRGTLTGEQPLLAVDNSALGGGYAVVTDVGFDSAPPVAKRFTTRGRLEIRVPDLRTVDASPDPRIPNSGGVSLYGRRLFPSQYDLGYAAYSTAGADEQIGEGDYAEPSTEIKLGYGYATGMSLASQFAYVLPLGFTPNDLTITGRWGWSPTPIDILDATYAVASRRWAERNAWFSDQMVTDEGLSLAFFKTLPAGARMALDLYRIPNIAFV